MSERNDNYWAVPGLSLTFEHVQNVVAGAFGIDTDAMKQPTRTRDVCMPRQICMFIGYTYLRMKGCECARKSGLGSHATVIHSVRLVRSLYATDRGYRRSLEKILGTLALEPKYLS